MKFEYLFIAMFVLVLGNLLWRYLRNGSIAGAMLGGSIRREVGEVAITSGAMSSRNLKVHAMESPEEGQFVALVLVSKAPLGAGMMPIKLSKSQAQALAELLRQAVL